MLLGNCWPEERKLTSQSLSVAVEFSVQFYMFICLFQLCFTLLLNLTRKSIILASVTSKRNGRPLTLSDAENNNF